MRVLPIIIICLFFVACGAKKSKSNFTVAESVVSSPTVSIDTGSLVGITTSNAINFVVTGSCSEENQPVIVSVGDVNPETAPICSNGSWEVTMDVSRLLIGASRPITITVDHSTSGSSPLDASPVSETITLYPRVGIATNLGNITGDTFTVNGTCSEDGQAIIVEVGGISPATAPTCTSGSWSVNVDVSGLGASGEINITANHSTSGSSPLDASPVSETVTLYPRVGIATNLGNITGDTFTVNGTCSENSQPITLVVGSITPSPAPTCTSGSWSVNVDVSGLGASGEIDITADHSTSGSSPLDATQASQTVTLYPRVGIAASLGNITEANASSFSVNGTCSEDGQVVTVSVGAVAASPAPNCSATGTWSADIDVSSLLTGASREITITANHSTSGASSLDAIQASETVTLVPRVSIAASVGNITGATFAVNGTCSEDGQAVTVSVGTVAASPAPTCTSTGTWSASVDVSGLTGASREITITANHETSGGLAAAPASETVTLAPRVGIATGLGNITEANAASFSVNGTCSENNQAVTISVEDVSATATCASETWTAADIDVSSLLTGASREITITANHETSGGLAAAPASETVTLAPRVGIATGLGNITEANAASFSVNGTCSENNQAVTISVGDVSATATCASKIWSASVDVSSLLTGASREITITANHSTSGGLAAAPASETVTLAPRVGIATGLGDITGATFAVNGICSEDGQAVAVSVGGESPSTAPLCTSTGTWSVSVDVSGLTGASREITITANHSTSGASPLDAIQASQTVTLYPRVGINTESLVDITSFNSSSFPVSGTCSEDGQPIAVSVGTVDAPTAPTCTSGAWSVDVDVSALSGTSVVTAITADHSTSSDPALSATQATASVLLNPPVSINTPALENITAINAASFVVSGACSENDEPVIVNVGGVSAAPIPNCTNGAWTTDIDVTGLNQMSGEISVTADHSPSGGPAHPQARANVTNHFTCPDNYVGVPALSDYTTNSFCVMKYEAKNDSGDAVSQASGTPYVQLDHDNSIAKCTALGDGHDMITNDEWQTLARNIELVPDNWATGAVGNTGGLSRGHSDNSPSRALAASNDDNDGCFETGQEADCDGSTWHAQRRTHTLSNGQVIWDVAGNVWEWVKDTNNFNYGAEAYMSQVTTASHPLLGSLAGGTTTIPRNAKDQFGPSGDYTSLSSTPYGGLGNGWLNQTMGGVIRGGYWNSGDRSGAFVVSLYSATWQIALSFGFRCVYHP